MKALTYLIITGASILFGWYARTLSQPTVSQATAPSKQTTPSNLLNTKDRTELCLALADHLESADSKTLHRFARQLLETHPKDTPIWKALFKQWFALDASTAWDFVSTEFDQKSHPEIFNTALGQWAFLDPRSAHQALADPSTDQLFIIIRSAMATAPTFAITILKPNKATILAADRNRRSLPWETWIFNLAKNPSNEVSDLIHRLEKPELLGAYLAGLATTSQDTALNWLNTQSDRNEILNELTDFLCHSEIYHSQLMDFANAALPAGSNRLVTMGDVLESLAYRDPDLATSETLRLFPDPHQQAEILAIIAEDLARTDFQAAWNMISLVDSSIHSLRRLNIPRVELTEGGEIQELSAPDGYAWDLRDMTGLVNPATFKGELLAKLLMVDRDATLKHLSAIPANDLLAIGVPVFEEWLYYEPDQAIDWLAKNLPVNSDFFQIDNFIWDADLSPELILAKLPEIPKSGLRDALIDQVADHIADGSKADAVSFIKAEGGSLDLLTYAYSSWASDDPRNALKSLTIDQHSHPEIWKSVTAETFLSAPEETIQAIDSLPPGKSRDLAFSSIARAYHQQSNPVTATKWALGIENHQLRQKSFDAIIDRTSLDFKTANDPQVKRQLNEFISSQTNLPEPQKTKWLNRLETEFPD